MSHPSASSDVRRHPSLRTVIEAAGLKPVALALLRLHQSLRGRLRRRFRLTVDGVEVVFVTEDARSKWFFHHRYRAGQMHEPPVTRELLARLRGAGVFVDVGAHIGYFGCVAGATNPDLRVFLFEMNHNLVPIIRRNLEANRIRNFEIVDRPVSDRRKVVAYDRGSTDPGLSLRTACALPDARQVETVTLDEVFLERRIAPDVIKIDVQGAELEALRGAAQLLRRHHPVLFLEVHPTLIGDFGATLDELYRFLATDLGYRLQRIDDHRGAGALLAVRDAADLPARTHMLLCDWPGERPVE